MRCPLRGRVEKRLRPSQSAAPPAPQRGEPRVGNPSLPLMRGSPAQRKSRNASLPLMREVARRAGGRDFAASFLPALRENGTGLSPPVSCAASPLVRGGQGCESKSLPRQRDGIKPSPQGDGFVRGETPAPSAGPRDFFDRQDAPCFQHGAFQYVKKAL